MSLKDEILNLPKVIIDITFDYATLECRIEKPVAITSRDDFLFILDQDNLVWVCNLNGELIRIEESTQCIKWIDSQLHVYPSVSALKLSSTSYISLVFDDQYTKNSNVRMFSYASWCATALKQGHSKKITSRDITKVYYLTCYRFPCTLEWELFKMLESKLHLLQDTFRFSKRYNNISSVHLQDKKWLVLSTDGKILATHWDSKSAHSVFQNLEYRASSLGFNSKHNQLYILDDTGRIHVYVWNPDSIWKNILG